MRLPESKLKLTLLTTVAVFLGAISICQIFEWMGFPEQDQVKAIKEMAGWNRDFMSIVMWILLFTPPLEEGLFRFPTRFIRHPAFAVLISAVFSFCHYIDFQSIVAGRGFAVLPISNAFLALFFVGLAWCWLYRRTGSLWCSMLSHSVFNGVNLILALLI